MLKLCASKTLNGFKKRREYLGISDTQAEKALQIFEKELKGWKAISRSDIKKLFEDWWIPMQKQWVYHFTCYAGTLWLICFGPPSENGEDTFVLVDEWIPKTNEISEIKQLEILAHMYFRAHGPATVEDFARWTGLGKIVSKQALSYILNDVTELDHKWVKYYYIASELSQTQWFRLLGGFDEYFIWYKDRSIVTDEPKKYFTVNGIFPPLMMQDGKIIGKRKRTYKKDKIKFIFFTNQKIDNKLLESQAINFANFQWLNNIEIDIKSLKKK